jgi:dTDP-4-amino-4,6-dideoxygalactose transaminase
MTERCDYDLGEAIKFLDLSKVSAHFLDELEYALKGTLGSSIYILGNKVVKFENEYANFVGAQYGVGVANGLDALSLSLSAVGVTTGDLVAIPANAYIAAWLAVSRLGAVPVPVDASLDGLNICPEALGKIKLNNIKALLVVHLYGIPVDLDQVHRIASQYNIPIIEDAAQAHGAYYKGVKIGAHSDLVCWSFYPTKNLGALGDAGAITTNNAALADKLRHLRNYGSMKRYVNQYQGINSRLDEIQAAVLSVKLKYLDQQNARRKEIAARYLELITNPQLKLISSDYLNSSSWHLFPVLVKERDRFREFMHSYGIETDVYYPTPPYLQPAYRDLGYREEDFPISSLIHRENVCLPLNPGLLDNEVDHIIEIANLFH